MKTLLFSGAAIAIIAAAYGLASPKKEPRFAPAPVIFKGSRPTTTHSNPTEIFQRAFWKHPSSTDKILHAERREWSDNEELKKWQWFIVVEPSTDLLKHLREDDAFGLIPVASMKKIDNPPAWFTPPSADTPEILQSPVGNMQLIFSKTKPLLYATDMGQGFASGAPEPVHENPKVQPTGRLPISPPPNPRKDQ